MHRDSLDAVRATTSARYHRLPDASCYGAGEHSRWRIRSTFAKPSSWPLSADSQFGLDQVTLIHRRELCVPAIKNPSDHDDHHHDVDHALSTLRPHLSLQRRPRRVLQRDVRCSDPRTRTNVL